MALTITITIRVAITIIIITKQTTDPQLQDDRRGISYQYLKSVLGTGFYQLRKPSGFFRGSMAIQLWPR